MFLCYKLQIESTFILLKLILIHLKKRCDLKLGYIMYLVMMVVGIVSTPTIFSLLYDNVSENYIIFSILNLLIILFIINFLMLFHDNVFYKWKSTFKYITDLFKVLIENRKAFNMEYKKCNMINITDNEEYNKYLKKYDKIIADSIYMQIFKLYFKNLNYIQINSEQQLININTDNLIELKNNKDFATFYTNILFKPSKKNILITKDIRKKLELILVEKIINTFKYTSWFKKYNNTVNISYNINHIIQYWLNKINKDPSSILF